VSAGLVTLGMVAVLVALIAPAVPPVPALVCVLAAVVALAVGVRGRRRALPTVAAVALVVVAATGVRLHHLEDGELVQRAQAASAAEVVVRVVGEPTPRSTGGWRTDVQVVAVEGRPSGQRAELGGDERLVFGATYSGRVEVRLAEGGWRRSRHVAVRLARAELEQVGEPGRVVAGTIRVRSALADAAVAALPPAAGGLATGLVTGDTSLLPEQVDEAMRATGLTHLTAVSGSNVALVVAGTWLLTGALGLGARGRRRTAVVVVLLFTLLTRADPSVLRASAMALVVLLAASRGRRVPALHALAGAVLVLVLLDPLLARRLGLLLSAAATLGVLVVGPRVRARLRPLEAVVRPRRILDLLAVTLGAQVAVLPVLLLAGGSVALATVPANLVAVPAAAVASVVCTAAAVVAIPMPALAAALLRVARPALEVVLWAARSLQWWGPTIGVATPLVLAMSVVVAGWLVATAGTRTSRTAATLTAGCVLVAVVVPAPSPPGDGFVLTAIDVGQGDAFLLTSGPAAVLVDTGRDRRAAAWLRAHGPRSLDLLVLTHADTDHTGGAPEVLEAIDVGAVWVRPRAGEPPPALAAALAAASAQGAPVHAPVAGQETIIGDLVLRVLAPAGPTTHGGLDNEENEASLVLRVDGPGGAVLVTGDIGPAAHDGLLGDPALRALLDVEVITVPHHGSRNVDTGLYALATPDRRRRQRRRRQRLRPPHGRGGGRRACCRGAAAPDRHRRHGPRGGVGGRG
jgi:competence protein ComEC